jgi:protein-tyrosine phosphatase
VILNVRIILLRVLYTSRVPLLVEAFRPYTRSHDSLLRRAAAAPSTPESPAISQNLALETSSRDSFYSCPDLSSLQISQTSAAAYGLDGYDGFDPDINTEPSRSVSHSHSPDHSAPRAKKRSKSQAVSRKARGVIGKVRAFQRIAASKMAHPSIKIDTNVQTTKRGPPADLDAALDAAEQGNPRLEAGNTEDVPPFLCQSVSGE